MGNLSRTYRPSRFADVTGQSRVTDVLRKAVEQNKLGHAYLFSGPRGVGKTTIARIFAKAVNCLDSDHGEPCLKCANCQRIAGQAAIDIIEMDAASHSGVENVREAIVEHVRFVPAGLRFKVYIIDEAHMLSTQAWNALLKTIEEPPAYALFIFATTERHKVPATIVSRCQRFEFTRIPVQDVVNRLKEIADKEGFKVQAEVFQTIAARTEGCLRDAENMLGQLFGLGEKNITADLASLVMPPSRLPIAAELLGLAAKRQIPEVLTKIEELEQEGVNLLPLFDDLLTAVRKLMLTVDAPDRSATLSQGDQGDQTVAKLVGAFEMTELLNISLVLMERRREVKQGLDVRFALELAMCAIASSLTRIGQSGGTPPPVAPSSGSSTTSFSQSKTPSVEPKVVNKIRPVTQSAPVEKAEVQTAPSGKIEPQPVHASVSTDGLTVDQILIAWPKFLEALENNKSLLFILKLCKPIGFENGKLILSFQYPYHQQTILKNAKNLRLIEQTLGTVLNRPSIGIEGQVTAAEEEQAKPQTTVGKLLEAFGGQVSS